MDDPRIVTKEFGLLNAGLFNKIRFPGRFEIDESDNRVVDSEYNMPRIDFTGDIAELYVEPDTFYLDGDNNLYMRKRKRDDEGRVVETKRLKVGELDIKATEELKRGLDSTRQIQARITEQVNLQFDTLAIALSGLEGDNSKLRAFTEELRSISETSIITEDRLAEEIRNTLGDVPYLANDIKYIYENVYSKREIDTKLSEEIQQRRTDGVNNADHFEALGRLFEQFSGTSSVQIEEMRKALSERYVTSETFMEKIIPLMTVEEFNRKTSDLLSKREYNVDRNNNLVTRSLLADEFYTKSDVDAQLGKLITELTSTNTNEALKVVESLGTTVNVDNFSDELAKHIPNYKKLVREDRLDLVRSFLLTDLNAVRGSMRDTDGRVDAFEERMNLLQSIFEDYRSNVTEQLSAGVELSPTQAEELKTALEKNDNLAGRIASNEVTLLEASKALGLGNYGEDRMFAKTSELDPIQAAVTDFENIVIPLQTSRIDEIRETMIGVMEDVTSTQVFAERNFVNKNDDDDIALLASKVQQDVQGYTRPQVRAFLDNWYNANLIPGVYPLKRLWGEFIIDVDTTRSERMTITPADGLNTTRSDGLVVSDKLKLATNYRGQDDITNPTDMIVFIDAVNSRTYFEIFLNDKNVYVRYPDRVDPKGGTDYIDGYDMRFHVTLHDMTKESTSNLAITNAAPVVYASRTVKQYVKNSRVRIDRIEAIRPWKAATNGRYPGKFKFLLRIECAPDAVPFNYIVT